MTAAREAASGPVEARGGGKQSAALVSIASNALLIVMKTVAGVVTGSVAIIAEAMQSSIDLLASFIAYVSIRKAEQPADDDHPWGHAKFENLAAVVEGMLILAGSAVIAYESVDRLFTGAEVDDLGFGIAVIAVSVAINLVVSGFLTRRARETDSPALEGDAAHLRTDAVSSIGVLGGLVLVQVTGASWVDPVVALGVAGAIVVTGVRIVSRSTRVLVDEALPEAEMRAIRAAVGAFGPRGVVGFHKLRARRAGSRRHVDLHVQFRQGTTLEDAHAVAHDLQDAIRGRLREADVLIHLEPEDRVRPGTEVPPHGPSEGEPGVG